MCLEVENAFCLTRLSISDDNLSALKSAKFSIKIKVK